jgi:flagellar basal-body rod modification protein FlgD
MASTTPVSGLVTDYVGKPNPTAAKPKKDGDEFGKDTFLKLLIAQLKYQDPTNPADSTTFLAQTAQFTTVEKLSDLATAQQDLLKSQQQLGASNLIGRTISYQLADKEHLDKDGNPTMVSKTGVVGSVSFIGSTPTLAVGTDRDVALSSVTEVTDTPTDKKV